jgi:hypothetical protein
MSWVGVVVIDCTLIGEPPPTGTDPTLMRRLARRTGGARWGGAGAAVLKMGRDVGTARSSAEGRATLPRLPDP